MGNTAFRVRNNKLKDMKNQYYYQKQREAIMNDGYRQQLFKELFDLYSRSMPMVLKTKEGDVKLFYSDEVEKRADEIREDIHARDKEIFESARHYP